MVPAVVSIVVFAVLFVLEVGLYARFQVSWAHLVARLGEAQVGDSVPGLKLGDLRGFERKTSQGVMRYDAQRMCVVARRSHDAVERRMPAVVVVALKQERGRMALKARWGTVPGLSAVVFAVMSLVGVVWPLVKLAMAQQQWLLMVPVAMCAVMALGTGAVLVSTARKSALVLGRDVEAQLVALGTKRP